MNLTPFIQLKVGNSAITAIPPDKLLSFDYKSSLGEMASFQFTAVDPTFYELEEQLLLADDKSQSVYARFGYLQETISVTHRWLKGFMVNYVPKITYRGMELSANFEVMPADGIVNVQPRQFSGKISRVVLAVAEALRMSAEIEETDDEENEAHTDFNGSPRQWATGNLTLVSFVRKKLLPIARSKTSKGAYSFFVTHEEDGLGGPTLHFHSKSFKECTRRNGEFSVSYFAGQQDSVLEFEPSYDSKILGNYGVGSIVTRSFDEFTGQAKFRVDNVDVTESDKPLGDATKTVAPVNVDDPTSANVSHGIVTDKEITAKVSDDKAKNRWDVLHSASYTASLSLVGLPEYVNIEALDFVNVNVMLPYQGGWRKHWTSGRYYVTEAIHSIGSSYTIQCQLERAYAPVGTYER